MSDTQATAESGQVEGQVVEESTEVAGGGHAQTFEGTALVPREVRNEVLVPLDADEVIKAMEAYQELLPRLLDASDWQTTGDGQFVKKSGWRKIARAFNLSVQVVHSTIDRDFEGQPLRAHVVARAIAPNGTFQDGDGYCSVDESRFARAAGKQKLENDLRATATTRAKNRAISDLVGMGEVSAEEVTAGVSEPGEAPGDLKGRASAALTYLLDGDAARAQRSWGDIKAALGGHMPTPAAVAIITAATALRESRRGTSAEQPQDRQGALA